MDRLNAAHPHVDCAVITGSNGFIGSRLRSRLESEGIEVIGADLNSNPPVDISDIHDFRTLNIPSGATFFHLAAIPDSKSCSSDWKRALQVNIVGLVNALLIAEEKGASSFVFASSEWVYSGLGNNKAFEEDCQIDPFELRDLYARTKFVGELLVDSTPASFNKLVCRFGIVYGAREKPGSAIEHIVLSRVRQEPLTVGSFDTGRSFIHVDDLVSGLTSTFGVKENLTVNLAGSHFLSLKEIIQEADSQLGSIGVSYSETGVDPDVRGCDITRATSKLGWSPSIDLVGGVKELIETYLK